MTGTVDPIRKLTDAGGRCDDLLVLTGPLGAGAVTSALYDLGDTTARRRPRESPMTRDAAVALARNAAAHAATDVAGLGLLGHLHGLAAASGLSAHVVAREVPALPGALELLGSGEGESDAGRRNLAQAEAFTRFRDSVALDRRRLLADPADSVGLLLALAPGDAATIGGWIVGRLLDGPPGTIRVL